MARLCWRGPKLDYLIRLLVELKVTEVGAEMESPLRFLFQSTFDLGIVMDPLNPNHGT